VKRLDLLKAAPLGGITMLAACNPSDLVITPRQPTVPDGLAAIDPRLPIVHLRLNPDTSVPGVTGYDIELPDFASLARTGGGIMFEDWQGKCGLGGCSWHKGGCHLYLGMHSWPNPGIELLYHCENGQYGKAFDKEHTCLRCRGGSWDDNVYLSQWFPKLHEERHIRLRTPDGLAGWSKHKIIAWLKKYDFFPWQDQLHGKKAYGGRLQLLDGSSVVDMLYLPNNYGGFSEVSTTLWSSNREWPGGKHTFNIKLKQGEDASPTMSYACMADWLTFDACVGSIALSAGTLWTLVAAGALAVATVALVAAVTSLHNDGCITNS
jgi:hypothetical protein